MLEIAIALFSLVILWVIWSRPFVIRSLRMAFHSGRMGPAINEMDQFSNKVIKSTNPRPWLLHPHSNAVSLSARATDQQKRLGSTAFLVIHHGALLFERYWPPFTASTPTNSFSVAKSVVSILIGICLKDGRLSLDDPIAQFLPSFDRPEKDRVKIRHLLTMSSGLSWSESEGSLFSDNAKAYYGSDTMAMIDHLRVERPPGEVFSYASINTQILAAILEVVTGHSVAELAHDKLWPVIGAEADAYWNLDHPGGMEKAFCCLYAIPRDFARIGQLYLNMGHWGGHQIVTPSYVEASLQATPIHDIWINKPNTSYGMHWWIVQHRGEDYFYARGIRGQYVICSRKLDLVITRMGQRRNPVDRHTGHPPDLFDHINAGVEIFRSIPQ